MAYTRYKFPFLVSKGFKIYLNPERNSASIVKETGPTHWHYELSAKEEMDGPDSARFEKMIYDKYERDMENWHQQQAAERYRQLYENSKYLSNPDMLRYQQQFEQEMREAAIRDEVDNKFRQKAAHQKNKETKAKKRKLFRTLSLHLRVS